MRDWLDEVEALAVEALASPAGHHVMERLASIHAAVERVHPFLDGNGRTGRLLLNLLLIRLGYPPAVIQRRDRTKYLSALRKADAGSNGMLAEIIARAVADSLYRFVVPALASPSELVPLASLASDEVTAVALRNAAARGRLRAVHGDDGQWRSSRSWVGEYVESRHRRGNP
jgi:hypothetical protein